MASLSLCLLPPQPVRAITSTWRTSAPTRDWFDPLNWTSGVPHNVGDVARFTNTSRTTAMQSQLDAPATLAQLTLTGQGRVELTGAGMLTFTRPGNDDPRISLTAQGGGTLTTLIALPIIVPIDETLVVQQSGQTALQMDGVISGGGSISYVGRPTGPSDTRITRDNTYSGLTTIDVGEHTIETTSSSAFGDDDVGTVIRSGTVRIGGTNEPFVVERNGMLAVYEASTPTTGRITLVGGTLNPVSRLQHAEIDPIEIDSPIEIRGRGYIGRAPFIGDVANLNGQITGTGGLFIQGSGSDLLEFNGDIAIRGDVLASNRAYAAISGKLAPAGDLIVDGGISSARLNVDGDVSDFRGDVEIRLGRLTLESDMQARHLRVDARLGERRAVLNQGGISIADDAALTVESLEFYGGDIAGELIGVDQITKKTRIVGSLGRLGHFDGAISVEEGWLDVIDSDGLGSTVGPTTVEGRRRAAIVLYENTRVDEAIYLNNSQGLEFQGALIGSGEMAGQLHLGSQGSYVGGDGGDSDWSMTRGGNLRISGTIHGGALYKSGSGAILTISGAGHTYSGPTTILGGALVLAGNAHLASTSEVRISSGSRRANLLFDDLALGRSNDRLADGVPVHMRSGGLKLQGDATSREEVGRVVLQGGWNSVDSAGGLLRIGQLDRRPGALLSAMPIDDGRIELANATLDDGILGGWALYHREAYRPAGFATVVGDVLQQSARVRRSLNGSAPTQNVEIDVSETLVADVAVNSLTTTDTTDINLAGRRLAVESGGLLVLGRTNIIGGSLTAGSGGPSELFLHDYFGLRIGANIVDNGGPLSLNVSGIGFVELSGINSYTGGTRITKSSGIRLLNRTAAPADDVVEIDGGRYLVDFEDGQPLKLERLILHGGSVEGSQDTPIDASLYETYSGYIDQPLAGTGALIKRGEGNVTLATGSPDYVGPITIEQGTLEVGSLGGIAPDEGSAIRVLDGGMLSSRGGLTQQRLVILEGGALRTGALTGSARTFSAPIEVRGSGAIRVARGSNSLSIESIIRGDGELTLDAPFSENERMSVGSNFNDFHGDVIATGGTINFNGSNAQFTGLTTIRAANAHAFSATAFGPRGAVVEPEGFLTVNGSMTQPLHLAGGVLIAGAGGATTGPLRVSADSLIETTESEVNSTPSLQHVRASGPTTFDSDVRIKQVGPGKLTFSGSVAIGQNVEIVAWEGAVEFVGTITPTSLGSTLNLRGNDNFTIAASVNVPAGRSFSLLKNGVDEELRFTSPTALLSGAGIIVGDVDVRAGGTIAPAAGGSPLTIAGDVTIGPGAVYDWDLTDSDGDSDAWSQLDVTGALTFTATAATPWILRVKDADLQTPVATFGALANKVTLGSGLQQWVIASAANLTTFDPAAVKIEVTDLVASQPAYADGVFSLVASGGDLILVYAIPEPCTHALLVLGVIGIMVRRTAILRPSRI